MISVSSRPLIILCLVLSISCGRNNDSEIPDIYLDVEFRPKIGTTQLTLGEEYQIGSQTVTFSKFKLFVSQFNVTDSDGESSVSISDELMLIEQFVSTIRLGKIDKEQLSGISFRCGLSDEQHMSAPNGAELSDEDMSHEWSSTQGYRNIIIEGTLDGEPFSYHLIGNEMSVAIEELPLNVLVDANVVVKIDVQLENLFEDLALIEGEQHNINGFLLSIRENILESSFFEIQ